MSAPADWRNENAYPPAGEQTLMARWHWEFLRRNRNYQEDYRRFQSGKGNGETDPEERQRLARKYGLDGMMFDFRDPLDMLFASARDPGKIRTLIWQTAFAEDEDGQLTEHDPEDLDYLDPKMRQHECCVVFNLRGDVNAQLEGAREYLHSQQIRFAEKRGRVDLYPLFLRLLDAVEDGVSNKELGKFFFASETLTQRELRISDSLQQAKLLRDVNYRYL